MNREVNKGNIIIPEIPEELTKQQKDDLKTLCYEYADRFAQSALDFEATPLLEHRIYTGDAVPIKQPSRRQDPKRRS